MILFVYLYVSIYPSFLYLELKGGWPVNFFACLCCSSLCPIPNLAAKCQSNHSLLLSFTGRSLIFTDKVHLNKSLITAFSDLKMRNFAIFFAALFFVFAMVRKCCFFVPYSQNLNSNSNKSHFFQQGAPSRRAARNMF